MELALESDIYSPKIGNDGNYIDDLPSSHYFINGLKCPCGARKNNVYTSRQSFINHIKTKTHGKWLNGLNLNKTNYYSENIKLNDTVHNQQLIISTLHKNLDNKQMEINELKKQLFVKSQTIDILTKQLVNQDKNSMDDDLIIFD